MEHQRVPARITEGEVLNLDPAAQRARWKLREVARSPLAQLQEGEVAVDQIGALADLTNPQGHMTQVAVEK